MKYQVVFESNRSAIVKTAYLNKSFSYVFLTITFEGTNPAHTMKDGVGKYNFASIAFQPMPPVGDPKRFNTIRQEFHRLNDINVIIEAESLKEACLAFAQPYGDVFEIVGKVPK